MRGLRFSFTVTGLLLLWIRFRTAHGFERMTAGPAGLICEEGFRRCPKGPAVCEDNTCSCPEDYTGKGSFTCFPKGNYHLSIISDPLFHTLTGETAHVNFPCRYPVAHFVTQFRTRPNSTCEVQINAFNKLIRGKYYVHGFDVALNLTVFVHNKLSSSYISYRKIGSACNGTYKYEEMGVLKFLPNGPWQKFDKPLSLDLINEVVMLRHNPINNFAYLDVHACGFRIDFRAYDECHDFRQLQVPGLAVSVRSDAVRSWLTGDRFITFTPGFPMSAYARRLKLSLEQALVFSFIASSDVEQNQPDGPPQCAALYDIVKKNTDSTAMTHGIDTCWFMMSSPQFISCYNGKSNADPSLSIFVRCVRSFRKKNRLNCEDADHRLCKCAGRLNVTASGHNYNRVCCRPETKSKSYRLQPY